MNNKFITSACPAPLPVLNRLGRSLSSSRQGIKDTIVSAVPQIVGVFTGFFGSVLVARGLGPEGMGQYALVMSLAGIATVLSDLGIRQTAIRYASRAAAIEDTPLQMAVLRWAFRWRLTLVLLSTTAFFLLVPCIADLWHSEALIPYMRLGLLGGLFAAFASVPTTYFQSIKRFSTNASVTSAQKMLSFAGILVLSVFSLWSLLTLVIVNLVASAIGVFVFLVIVPKAALWCPDAIRKQGRLSLRHFFASPKFKQDAGRELDSSSPAEFMRYHMLATIICMVIMQADIWMMGYFLDKSELGIYSVAIRFTLPLTIALGALSTALWPRASGTTEPRESLKLFRRTLKMTALVAALATAYALLAPIMASLLFGTAYAESRLIGQILCLRYVTAFLASPLMIVGYSFGLVRVYWLVHLVQMVMVVSIMWVFLPVYGSVAASIALLTMELVGNGMICVFLLASYRRYTRELRLQPG